MPSRIRPYCETIFLSDSLQLLQLSVDAAFHLLFTLQLLTQMLVLGS